MPHDQPSRSRKNTVKRRLTPAGWLLARYDATGPGGLALIKCLASVQPMFTLKSVHDHGEPMRVTASDYADPGRWWL
jgi:hypothetical protein